MLITCDGCGGFGEVGRKGEYEQCPFCEGLGVLQDAPPTGQSRKMSAAEVITGTAIGFVVAVITTHFVMPAFGHPVTMTENFWITSIFTVVSIVRGYFVRRLFEAWRG